jgi:diguanylate cyclase (GGDEF)-like protein
VAENKKDFTILITDDEKLNVNILGEILSPMYNLLISRSGARAIDLAKEHRPDLILLDVIMPEMTGFDAIKILKESEITNNIPVIFITGLTDAKDEEMGLSLGAVDYIAKPFNKSIVKARVSTHLKIVEQMRTIEQLSLVDPLTRVSNRRGFENRLRAEWGSAIREQKPISILMMDIDKFKTYNDTYGHQQGDTALKSFAQASATSLSRSTDFIARWGGEEFIILLPNTNREGAAEVAERVRKNVEDTVILTENASVTKITVSIGINIMLPATGDTIENFIEAADQALYKAKESGRNRYVISGE